MKQKYIWEFVSIATKLCCVTKYRHTRNLLSATKVTVNLNNLLEYFDVLLGWFQTMQVEGCHLPPEKYISKKR